MEREQELRAYMGALARKSADLMDAAKKAGRDLSEEEVAKVEAWAADHDATKAQLDEVVAEREKREKLQARVASMRDVSDRSQGRMVPAQASEPDVAVTSGQREMVQDDPKKGFATPRAFIQAVIKAGMDRKVPEALRPLVVNAAVGSDEAATFSDPYGGFTIPEAFSPNLLTTMYSDDPMGSRTTKIPMTASVVKIPARVDKTRTSSVTGGLIMYRRAEADTVSATRMEFEQIMLEANPLMGISYATEEILSDSPVSFAALIAAGFADEYRSKLATERISGTGVGEFEGIDNSGSLITITKESGQAANTIVTANILKMRERAWKYSNCIWMANQTCLPQLAQLTITNGTSVVPIYHFSMQEDVPDMLMGRPVIYTEECAALSSAGDLRLVNWSEYLEGTYQNLMGTSSIHVRFVNNERAFRFTARNAGAMWWRSALTPKNGSTLSPNVRLGAR